MGLLDVNALVAVCWDSHVHHTAALACMHANANANANAGAGWATCAMTEAGFVAVSSNPRLLPGPVDIHDARAVLSALRALRGHRFLTNDVSPRWPTVATSSCSLHPETTEVGGPQDVRRRASGVRSLRAG